MSNQVQYIQQINGIITIDVTGYAPVIAAVYLSPFIPGRAVSHGFITGQKKIAADRKACI